MKHILVICNLFFVQQLIAQPTVGLKTYDASISYEGMTLFDPLADPGTYLIDNCGKLVHSWQSAYKPRLSSYLLENGNLLRTCKGGAENPAFNQANPVGRVELLDWNSTVLWSYVFSNDTLLQHHDIEPMPNGNILILAWDMMNNQQALDAGRNPALLPDNMLWPDEIIEIEMVGTDQINEVWRWRFQDHLIQDFDSNKDNFGVVADHPELVDINVVNNNGAADWIHGNSIAYNADRDEIVISSRKLSEIYIIDHSTTTEEAAAHLGGNKGKGGDFLYRWGNPEVYDHGSSSDRKLYGQHDAHWIPDGYPDEGKIIMFNNGRDRTPFEYSTVDIIQPPMIGADYEYTGSAYGPDVESWSYQNVGADTLFASFISGAHQLPNGNVLFCDGPAGTLYEVDASGSIGWEYVVPVNSNGPITQGNSPTGTNTFRARRYALDYPGLIGDLTPGEPIEINPGQNSCEPEYVNILSPADNEFELYPNPSTGVFYFEGEPNVNSVEVFNTFGSLILKVDNNLSKLDLAHLPTGVYHLVINSKNGLFTKNVVVGR